MKKNETCNSWSKSKLDVCRKYKKPLILVSKEYDNFIYLNILDFRLVLWGHFLTLKR